MRLVELAHQHVAQVLNLGDLAIDATAGNGYDALHLARCVGPRGNVLAIDTQAAACAATTQLLSEHAITWARVVAGSHAETAALLDSWQLGAPRAAMLNLGYLPGGDPRITTEPLSTLACLRDLTQRLAPGGVLTVLAYTGHPGGRDEAQAVADFVAKLPHAAWQVQQYQGPDRDPQHPSPVLYALGKQLVID